jgi:hypothetical protein
MIVCICFSHGTRCAGQVAASKNEVCGVGVAYNAKIAGKFWDIKVAFRGIMERANIVFVDVFHCKSNFRAARVRHVFIFKSMCSYVFIISINMPTKL